jgi:hypothetical protein
MNRYTVEVKVTYNVTAKSISDAYRVIHEGAEFPVVPWDDETYCSEVSIVSVKELSSTPLLVSTN